MRIVPMRWAILLALGFSSAVSAVSIDELMRQAQAGDVVAQREFGQVLLYGQGLPRDVPAGLEWLQMAEAKNDPYAAFLLARHFEQQPTTPANHNTMVRYYRRAAAAGHTTAQARLGEMLLERTTDTTLSAADRTKARSQGEALLLFAANANNGYAALKLAAVREEGQFGLPVDHDAALALYRQAASAGQTSAAVHLAEHYLNGDASSDEDTRVGVGYLVQAANDGMPSAMFELARRFAEGRGVPKDDVQAERWAKQAQAAGINVDAVLDAVAALRRERNPNPEERERDLLAIVPKRLEVASPPPALDNDDPDRDGVDEHPDESALGSVASTSVPEPKNNTATLTPDMATMVPVAIQVTLPTSHMPMSFNVVDLVSPGAIHFTPPALPSINLSADVARVAELAPAITTQTVALQPTPKSIAVATTINNNNTTTSTSTTRTINTSSNNTAATTVVPTAQEVSMTAEIPANRVDATVSHDTSTSTAPHLGAASTQVVSQEFMATLNARLETMEHQIKVLEAQRDELAHQLKERDAAYSQLRDVRDKEIAAADHAEATVEALRASITQVDAVAPAPIKVAPPTTKPVVTAQDVEQWNEAALTALRDKDFATALTMLAKAGDAGDGTALNNLGMMYIKGLGTAVNTATAMSYFERAVAAGNGGAASNLGYIWLHGMGVTQNRDTAAKWYQRGAELGNAQSAKALQRLNSPKDEIAVEFQRVANEG